MKRWQLGDELIYFGPWEAANGQECIVESLLDGGTRYGFRFPKFLNLAGKPDYCTSSGTKCILKSVYNSPLYKALL